MSVELAERFAAAMDAEDIETVEEMLAADAEITDPSGKTVPREAWLAAATAELPPAELESTLEGHAFEETPDGIVMSARQVFRWKESGELAYEQPFGAVMHFRGDELVRMEMRAG